MVAWSDIYILRASGWLVPNPNPNPKEGKREKIQLEFLFESTFFGWIDLFMFRLIEK